MSLSPSLRFLASHQWAIEDATFERLVAILERHAAGEKLDAEAITAAIGRDPNATDAAEPVMQISGDTAVIPMRGVLARYADSVNGMCQARGRSAESVQRDLIAAADRGVNRIILQMDSPGGEVSGTAETADLVRQLSARGIEMVAFIDGKSASAAYWIASQADEIVASAPTALVGSIGVATAIIERATDNTKGDKVHVITSAPAKSSPVLNEAQLANARSIVTDLAQAFAGAVAAGRGLDEQQAAKVATGEVWTAQQGIALGLVDRISSLAALIARRPSPAGAMSAPARTAPAASAEGVHPADNAAAHGDPMRITAMALAALVAAFPHHATLISERAKAGDEEASIRDLLAGKDREAAEKATSDLKASLLKEQTEHKATAEKLTKLQADHDHLAALAKGAPRDPGSGSPPGAGEVAVISRADYEKNPAAYAKALRLGQAKLAD
jgi:ClpP class serine protease